MNTQRNVDQIVGLIVTPNFVEAEDIADELKSIGLSQVVHRRNAAVALKGLDAQTMKPNVALLSFDHADAEADLLIQRLLSTGAYVILINGDARGADDRGAVFLRRPYTGDELAQCIKGAMAGQ